MKRVRLEWNGILVYHLLLIVLVVRGPGASLWISSVGYNISSLTMNPKVLDIFWKTCMLCTENKSTIFEHAYPIERKRNFTEVRL